MDYRPDEFNIPVEYTGSGNPLARIGSGEAYGIHWRSGEFEYFSERPEVPKRFLGSIRYPPFSTDEVVPFYGGLYRAQQNSNRLKRIPDKQIPADIAVKKDSITIPLRHKKLGGKTSLNGSLLVVEAVNLQTVGGKKVAVAELRRRQIGNKPLEPGSKWIRIQIRAGDVLKIANSIFKVRNVVPRDRDKGHIGWIELSPPKWDFILIEESDRSFSDSAILSNHVVRVNRIKKKSINGILTVVARIAIREIYDDPLKPRAKPHFIEVKKSDVFEINGDKYKMQKLELGKPWDRKNMYFRPRSWVGIVPLETDMKKKRE